MAFVVTHLFAFSQMYVLKVEVPIVGLEPSVLQEEATSSELLMGEGCCSGVAVYGGVESQHLLPVSMWLSSFLPDVWLSLGCFYVTVDLGCPWEEESCHPAMTPAEAGTEDFI